MTRFSGIPQLALSLLLIGTSVGSYADEGFADPVLGRWDLTIASGAEQYPSWVEIRLRTESQLMAEFVGRFGSMRHASTVRFEQGQLTFSVPVQYEGGGDTLVFTGQLRDDELAGMMRIGDKISARWTGRRAPALARTRVAAWGQPQRMLEGGLGDWRLRDERLAGCWSLADGVLSATPPCADLISDATFEDFRLHLEFRYPEGSNSGVYLRGRYELQIQDDLGKAADPLRIGGVYGFIAPERNAAREPGAWQSYDIELVGRRITAVLNGIEIISQREIPGITGGALDSDEAAPGPLMLQGDHGPIEYRNIVITPAL